ncbi:MAG: hypothetical protein PVI26_03265, partial [Chitinispirillia bacterium]
SVVLAGKIKIQPIKNNHVKLDLISSSIALRKEVLNMSSESKTQYWWQYLSQNNRKENLECSALIALKAYKNDSSDKARDALLNSLTYLSRPIMELKHNDYVIKVLFSPGGKLIASCGWDKSIKIWNSVSYQTKYDLVHDDRIKDAVFSSNNKYLLSHTGKAATLWNVTNGEKINYIKSAEKIIAVKFSNDSKKFLLATEKTNIFIGNTSDGIINREVTNESGRIIDISFNKNGKTIPYIAYIAGDNKGKHNECFLKQIKASNGKINKIFKLAMPDKNDPQKSAIVINGFFNADGSHFSIATRDNAVYVWNAESGKELKQFKSKSPVEHMAFRNDNKIIVLITGPYARIYDIKDGKELLEISHNDRIFTAVFSVNNNLIATGSQDGTVRIFDISANREIKRLTPQKNIYSLSFSPDGKNIAATHQNNSALVYKLTYDNIEEYACWNIGRNLTLEEWQKYIGDDIYKELCSINLIK